MLPIRSILVPTDFSERSGYAFRLACSVARDHGARLTVLHVVPPPMAAYVGGVMTPEPDRHEGEWARLRLVQPPEPGLPVEHLLAEGDAGEAIVRAAREGKCDLIVLGTHGRTGLGRTLLGSVAEKVLRQALCPVLTVKTPFPVAAAEVQAHTEPETAHA
jgi:nucleotide-binding universal stress UspA family protein